MRFIVTNWQAFYIHNSIKKQANDVNRNEVKEKIS